MSVLFTILYLIKLRMTKSKDTIDIKLKDIKPRKGKGNVDAAFLHRILELLKIVIPSWKSKEVLNLVLLTLLLVVRTFLTIYISSINGRIVNAIVQKDFNLFIRRVNYKTNFSI